MRKKLDSIKSFNKHVLGGGNNYNFSIGISMFILPVT